MNYSAAINAAFLDPARDEDAFWNLIKSYVGRTANKMAPQELLDEIVQDVLVQIFTSMHKFKSIKGSKFSHYICAITFNRAKFIVRSHFTGMATPVSQLGVMRDDNTWQPMDISALGPQLSDEEYEDSLAAEVRPEAVASTLTSLESKIPARDSALFNAMRKTGQVTVAATAAGIHHNTAKTRVQAWRLLTDSPGAPTHRTAGIPVSTRPDGRLSEACAAGNEAALAIAKAWRFSHKVKTMPAAEFDALAERGYTNHFVD